MTDKKAIIAHGPEDAVAVAEDLLTQAQRGDLKSAAIRVFKSNGTWENVVIAETEEETAATLASLRQMYDSAH